MRFSRVVATAAILIAPWPGLAQDAGPAGEPEAAAETQAAEPAADTPPAAPVWVEDDACLEEIPSGFAGRLGEPSARLDPQQAVYTPAGVTVLGNPVAYVIVTRSGGDADAPVQRLTYRLARVNNTWGSDYPMPLRRAFDDAFDTDSCAEEGATCLIDFTGGSQGRRTGIELSNRMVALPPGTQGSALPLLKADYDLEGADPVFLVCHYGPR